MITRPHTGSLLVAIAVLAVCYFVTGRIGLLLAIPPGYATAIWPASGIALAALLLYGYRLWPGILLGSLLVNVATSFDPSTALSVFKSLLLAVSVGLGASLQALLGAFLVRHFIEADPGLIQPRNVLGVLGVGGPLSCLMSACWGIATLWSFGLVSKQEAPYSWTTWWVGDSIGVVLVLPLIFIWLAEPRPLWERRKVSVALPLLVTLLVAIAIFVVASVQEQNRLEVEYERQGITIGDALEKNIASYLEAVYSVQRLFVVTEEIDREQFKEFVARTLDRIPGIQALSWNPRINHQRRLAYETAARSQGHTDFNITERSPEGQLIPASQRPEYIIVWYIEPYQGNDKAFGYDVYSNPVRRVALDRARDSGDLVATARITLVQETGNQAGILIFLPIYSSTDLPMDVAARRINLVGYVVGVFRTGDMLASALAGLGVAHFEARLLDMSAEDDDRLLAHYRTDSNGIGELLGVEDNATPSSELSWSKEFLIGDRTWKLLLTPAAGYSTEHRSWAAWGVLVSELSFAGLLCAFLLILTGRAILDERRADVLAHVNSRLNEEMVRRRHFEQDLYEQKERAEVTLHSIGDAVITTDAHGAVDYMNPVAEKMTEWSSAEAQHKPLSMVFQIIHEETREPVADPAQRCRMEGRIIGLANHSVLISRSGREYSIQDSAAPICDRDGRMLGVILVFHDVTESRRMAREAAHHATHDALTGLVNRREFDRRLEQALDTSKRYAVRNALCYLDLDQFKIVNDVAGHRAGDELLKHLTTILKKQVRERDTLARLGGDEFGLLLGNCPIDKALDIAETMVASVREFKFVWDKRSFDVGVSIGLVEITGEVHTAEELLTHADVACYAAKDLGCNRVHLYQMDSTGSDPRHREILRAADMRNAIERNRFRLYCQPIVPLGTAEPLSERYEILLRLLDDRDQLVVPGGFIPAAERFGIMNAIDRWVVRSTLRDLDKLFPDRNRATISINLSGNSLNDGDLLPFLKEMISQYCIDPQQICFEITETAAIRNLTAAGRLIRAMRDLGGHFALDDFGTGLSSFAYLKNLPVNYLKIDGSLVRNISNSDNDRAIVEALNQLAHRLGIETVAEYAETVETLSVLRELGVDYAQGYALGRPIPLPLENNEIKVVRGV